MGRQPRTSSEHPPTWTFDLPIFHAESRAQWRTWLEVNHDSARGVWLCSWRDRANRAVCPYPEAVEEAICFGWIDATVNVLDDERSLQLMTPRKAKSSWTRLNRRRADAMEAAGLMTDAGRRAIEVARRNGSWTIYDSVEDLVEPPALAAALDAHAAARRQWDAFPPSAKKAMLWWVVSAARDETKDRRVAAIVEQAAAGQRARG
jgi:uncharacterized protein YdeI (YjbR/CyaY-like superfamily)